MTKRQRVRHDIQFCQLYLATHFATLSERTDSFCLTYPVHPPLTVKKTDDVM